VAAAIVTTALAPGLLALPGATAQELDAKGAAFFAAQHRLTLSARPLHTHFLTLHPFVTDDELPGWVQGYGLHTARDWRAQSEVLGIEFRDAMTMEGFRPAPVVDRRRLRREPSRWLEVADLFDANTRPRFFEGLGLGIGEDGAVDTRETQLLRAVASRDLPAIWRGIGGALGERVFHSGGDLIPLTVEGGSGALGAALPLRAAFQEGLVATAGPHILSAEQMLPEGIRSTPDLRVTGALRVSPSPFALPHPLTYSPLGTAGRSQRAATVAP
jgi:hypothetical protein